MPSHLFCFVFRVFICIRKHTTHNRKKNWMNWNEYEAANVCNKQLWMHSKLYNGREWQQQYGAEIVVPLEFLLNEYAPRMHRKWMKWRRQQQQARMHWNSLQNCAQQQRTTNNNNKVERKLRLSSVRGWNEWVHSITTTDRRLLFIMCVCQWASARPLTAFLRCPYS